jgi:hypothetical protein
MRAKPYVSSYLGGPREQGWAFSATGEMIPSVERLIHPRGTEKGIRGGRHCLDSVLFVFTTVLCVRRRYEFKPSFVHTLV